MSEEQPDRRSWGMTPLEFDIRRQQIFELRRQGLSYRAIAKIVGLHHSRIYKIYTGKYKKAQKTKGSFFKLYD